MRKSLLRAMARWTVAVLLLGQFTIAAHACQVLSAAAVIAQSASVLPADRATDVADAHSMAGCDEVALADQASPNLCVEHCRFGQQSDHTTGFGVPVGWPVVLYELRLQSLPEPGCRSAASSLSDLVAASPPHAILHCVRRT